MNIAETRKLVDEISMFLIGSAPGIKDLIRIGKKADQAQSQSGYKRPTLVKFGTVWDKRLIFTAKAKLKTIRLEKIFIRKDMSNKERLAASLSRKARLTSTLAVTSPIENQPSSDIQSSDALGTSSFVTPAFIPLHTSSSGLFSNSQGSGFTV